MLVGAAVVMVVGRVVVKFGLVFLAVVAAEKAKHHHYISLDIKSTLSMNIN